MKNTKTHLKHLKIKAVLKIKINISNYGLMVFYKNVTVLLDMS